MITNNPTWLAAYKKVLEELEINPDSKRYSGTEDAGDFVYNRSEIHRFCILSNSENGEYFYANANFDTVEQAISWAVENIDDDIYNEIPIAIVDLETGQRLVPNFKSIQWTGDIPQPSNPLTQAQATLNAAAEVWRESCSNPEVVERIDEASDIITSLLQPEESNEPGTKA